MYCHKFLSHNPEGSDKASDFKRSYSAEFFGRKRKYKCVVLTGESSKLILELDEDATLENASLIFSAV